MGKLSDNDEPDWVMRTITKMVQQRMESFRQMQMSLDELTQPQCGDATNCIRERDMKYANVELKVLAVVKPQIDTTPATSSPTTVGEHMQTLQLMREQSEMPAVTSRPGCRQVREGSEKPQSHQFIPDISPGMATDLMPAQDARPVEPISFYPGVKHS